MGQMALPPCHFAWNVVVYGDTISLIWHQRSCDLILGVPFNIASYASLLLLLAKDSGLKPWKLTGTLNDCHIYENQIPAAREQLTREPRPLPQLVINDNTPYPGRSGGGFFDIFEWNHTQVELVGYDPHPKLDFGAVTV